MQQQHQLWLKWITRYTPHRLLLIPEFGTRMRAGLPNKGSCESTLLSCTVKPHQQTCWPATYIGTSCSLLPGSCSILPAAALMSRCIRCGESSTSLVCSTQHNNPC